MLQSSNFLLLYDDDYLDRLWCVVELAFFVKSSGARRIWFSPLWAPRWLLKAFLLTAAVSAVHCLVVMFVVLPSESEQRVKFEPDRGWKHLLTAVVWGSPLNHP